MTNISWKVWLPILLAFVVGGLNSVLPLLASPWSVIVSGLLSLLAVYMHGGEVAKAASTRQ